MNPKKFDILVIGDIMLDRYWWGSVTRISPEAPVPVVRLDKTSVTLGGAANVAANIAGLGMTPEMIGIIGDDSEGRELGEIMSAEGLSVSGLVALKQRPTTVKTRVVAHGQQVTRVDQEVSAELSDEEGSAVLERINERLPDAKAVVVSDYAKGLLSEIILRKILEMSHAANIPVLVDPKGKRYSKYSGATILTPNKREAAEACAMDESEPGVVEHAGNVLMKDLGLDALLITRGEEGMTLFEKSDEPRHMPTRARKIYDVTGAGDTVIAAMAVGLASGKSFADAAAIANAAAGLAVEQVGTTIVTKEMLAKEGILL
jgi:D-beta-D-heptose 7-phosphate kinase/D-beta-D-heptose 1-phosphate adenosyltransferase